MTAQIAELLTWTVIVFETDLSVRVRVVGVELDKNETRGVIYHVAARSPREAQNIVANRIHRALLGFPQDPTMEGPRP